MIVYIMTGDLAWRPHFLSRHPLSMPADNGEGHPIP
jgi:hypothetical protein